MTALLLAALAWGPLTSVPPHWSLEEALCIHSRCGRYTDAQSGAVVDFVVSEEELPSQEPCEVPSVARGVRGKVDGHWYCGFEAADAREVELAELARFAPDLLAHVDDPARVQLSEEGTSLVRIYFVSGNTTAMFAISACGPEQIAAFRRLLLESYRLRLERRAS